ncbi:MAG: hypothetical protein IJV41_11715 [Oscillospiraceae bacterium]|nr:hypothetical protein [Oscillospiraceae bacterium]
MQNTLRELVMVSICCGAAMTLCPEGGIRQVLKLLCTAVLILSVLTAIKGFDFSVYALEQAKLTQTERELNENGKQAEARLNRRIVESQYNSYISERAMACGIQELRVEVETQWNLDGLWVPFGVTLTGHWDEGQRRLVQEILRDELGIPWERQTWISDGQYEKNAAGAG